MLVFADLEKFHKLFFRKAGQPGDEPFRLFVKHSPQSPYPDPVHWPNQPTKKNKCSLEKGFSENRICLLNVCITPCLHALKLTPLIGFGNLS